MLFYPEKDRLDGIIAHRLLIVHSLAQNGD